MLFFFFFFFFRFLFYSILYFGKDMHELCLFYRIFKGTLQILERPPLKSFGEFRF